MKKKMLFDPKKYIHITFAGKVCNIPIENLRCCPLHWNAALGRQRTTMNLHVNVKKIELSSSRSQLFKVQPTDNVTHLFGIAMSIFKIMVI